MKYDIYRSIIEGKELPTEEELFYEVLLNDYVKYEIQFAKHMLEIKKKYPSLCCFPKDFLDKKIFRVNLNDNYIGHCDLFWSDYFEIIGNDEKIQVDNSTNKIVKAFLFKNYNNNQYLRVLDYKTYYFSNYHQAKEFLKSLNK